MKKIMTLKPVIRLSFPEGMHVLAVEWDDAIGINAMLLDEDAVQGLPAYEESADKLVNRLAVIKNTHSRPEAGRYVSISDAPDTLMIVLGSGQRIFNDAYVGGDSSAA